MDVFKSKSLSSITSQEDIANSNKTFIVDVPEELRAPGDPRFLIAWPSMFKNVKTTMPVKDFLKQIKSCCGKTEDCELCQEDKDLLPVQNRKEHSYPNHKESGVSKKKQPTGNFNHKHYHEHRPPLRRKPYRDHREKGIPRRQPDPAFDPWICNPPVMNHSYGISALPFQQNYHQNLPLLPLPQTSFPCQDTQQYHNPPRTNFHYPPHPPSVYNDDARYTQHIQSAPLQQQEQSMLYNNNNNMHRGKSGRRNFNGRKNRNYRR